MSETKLTDYVRFDRQDLLDMQGREGRSDKKGLRSIEGKGWGYGRRKSSSALCSVKAGTGRIKINGKPMNVYF